MNSTKWLTLTGFVNYLGREGVNIVWISRHTLWLENTAVLVVMLSERLPLSAWGECRVEASLTG